MKNVMDYFHREAETCVCVSYANVQQVKDRTGHTIKSYLPLNRQDGGVFVRSRGCGQVASINPPFRWSPGCVCLCMYVKMNVMICVSLRAPQRRIHGGLGVCDSLSRNFPYFSIQ